MIYQCSVIGTRWPFIGFFVQPVNKCRFHRQFWTVAWNYFGFFWVWVVNDCLVVPALTFVWAWMCEFMSQCMRWVSPQQLSERIGAEHGSEVDCNVRTTAVREWKPGPCLLGHLYPASRQWKQQALMRKGKPVKETDSVKFISWCNKAASLGVNLKWPLS